MKPRPGSTTCRYRSTVRCGGGISELPDDRHVAGRQCTGDVWREVDEVEEYGAAVIDDLARERTVGCGALLSRTVLSEVAVPDVAADGATIVNEHGMEGTAVIDGRAYECTVGCGALLSRTDAACARRTIVVVGARQLPMSGAGRAARRRVVVAVTEREDESAAGAEASSRNRRACGRAGCSLLVVALLSCAVWYGDTCPSCVICRDTAFVRSELSLVLAVLGDHGSVVRESACRLARA